MSSDTKLLGCLAAVKIAVAFSMPTVWSVGACITSSALRRLAMHSLSACPWASSTKSLRIVKLRPASVTGDAVALDVGELGVEMVQHVGDVGGAAIVTTAVASHAVGGGEHRGAAERVADEQGRRREPLAQMVGGAHQVLDVGGERGVGELALRRAEPGEVEAQDGDARPASRQCGGRR